MIMLMSLWIIEAVDLYMDNDMSYHLFNQTYT